VAGQGLRNVESGLGFDRVGSAIMVVSCPQCGKKLKARDELAGQPARCACGAVFTLPMPLDAKPAERAVPSVAATTAARREVGASAYREVKPDDGAEGGKPSGIHLYFEGVRESLPEALRSMAVSVVVGSCLLVPGAYLLRSVLSAAEELVPQFDPRLALAPAILSATFGAVFGFLAGSRLTNRSGLVGLPACILGLVGVCVLVLVGAASGSLFFAGPIPSIFWLSLFCMGGMAAVGVCYYGLFGG